MRGVEGTAQAHAAGAVWEIRMTADQWNRMTDGIQVEHGQDGKHTSALVTTLKAAGSDIDAGTNDLKIVTPKAIKDSSLIFSSLIQRQGIINGGMEVSQELVASTVALVNNTAKYVCDLFSITPSGAAISAGTQAQISNSTLGTSGYALKLAGVTITGAGTIKKRYRVEAADAVKYKNKSTSFGMLELQDTGGSLNYTIQINKANSADNFSAVTQIAISGNLPVATGVGTRIVFENVSMGDCSNGIEIVVTIPCGAITTKNFETTEWQMNVGAVCLPFVCGTRAEESAKVMRYYEKSYDYAVIPGTSTLSGGVYTQIGAVSTVAFYVQVYYKVSKRINSNQVTLYDDIGSVNKVIKGANGKTASVPYYSTSGFVGGTADATSSSLLSFQWVVDARFIA